MSKSTSFYPPMSDSGISQTEESWQDMKKRQEKEIQQLENLKGDQKEEEIEKLKQKHLAEQKQHEITFNRNMKLQQQMSETSSEKSLPVINEMTFKLTELFAYVGETCEKIATEKSRADFLELQNKQVNDQLVKYKRKVKMLKAKNDIEALKKLEERIGELENKLQTISTEINEVNEKCGKLEEVKSQIEFEQVKKMETIRNLTMKREGLIRDQNELNRQINKLMQDNENLESETRHLKLSKEQKEAEYKEMIEDNTETNEKMKVKNSELLLMNAQLRQERGEMKKENERLKKNLLL